MLICVDESGSINNHYKKDRYFIITLIKVIDTASLKKAYKRFVSSNHDRLMKLDNKKAKKSKKRTVKKPNKMFINGKFRELKGSQFDKEMKKRFVEFFSKKKSFEIYYIKVDNKKLRDDILSNTSHVFNYSIRVAIEYFIKKGYFIGEDFYINLDERNEKIKYKYFLENYLNTELVMNGTTRSKFSVSYFDSTNNHMVQIADVFSNLLYSSIMTKEYKDEMLKLKEREILKCIFDFPN